MPRANATGIGTRQVVFLATKTDLGLKKTTILKILRFKMPTFEQVEEYAKKFSETDYNYGNKLWYSYRYYDGHTTRLRRRFIRYINLCLAMKEQIPVQVCSQIAQDLEEVDIELSNPMSVKFGWERVRSALQCTVDQFKKYAREATDLSSYVKLKLSPDWCYDSCEEERFGSEQLCFDLWLQFVASLMRGSNHWGKYVKPTERQLEEMKARREKAWEKVSEDMCKMLGEIIKDNKDNL